MTKIDIFSGFLGAGKTTLIKKLLSEVYKNEKTVLIENEFGEIGIDGGFLKEAGVEITEMNSGCICCSLVGDFSEALKKVLADFKPDRVLIEPSGVGKLSDVIKAVKGINDAELSLNSFTAVVDAKKCKSYMKNFGEFYNDQIENASCIVLSHTTGMSEEKIQACIELIREKNSEAAIVSTPWENLDGSKISEATEGRNALRTDLEEIEETEICPECGEHHTHEKNESCCCHGEHKHEHHHGDGEHACCHDEHKHSHHDESEHRCCHNEHRHDAEEGNHHHHHADDVFTSWGVETAIKFNKSDIEAALLKLENAEKYGHILRAKGIVEAQTGKWIHFDYIPGEPDVRYGSADIIGRLCVIGADINQKELEELFLIK